MKELENAIWEHNYNEVKRILEETPSKIDETDDEGRLMAFVAALAGDFSILKYVVEYSRASMNIYDEIHRNILHYGTLSGNPEIVRYLVERVGMDPLKGDKNLVTPFDLARENGFEAIEAYFTQVCGCGLDDMYRNPIRTGMFPDPSIVRVGEDYYMVNSSFIFFPCIPVSHSKDLVHWKIIGHAITNPEWAALDGLEGGRGFWAPDISYHDGKFFITATYRLNDTGTVYRKQFVMSSEKPEGPYGKPAVIDEDGIDPSIFVDDDGRKYMLLNRGARILELNKECTEQISPAELLFYGDNKRAPEGPHLLKKDGYYYLFEAEGGTGPGHRVTVSRSRTLKGVYEPCPYNPIMRQWDEGAAIQRCGHGKPVMTQNGQWYMVYLCGRMVNGKYSILGRETALDPITWTADGWPVVNGLKGPSNLNPLPNLPRQEEEDFREDFGSGRLSLNWITPRPPQEGTVCMRDGKLLLLGSGYGLDDTRCRSILVQRQKDFVFRASTLLGAGEIGEGQEAGITCYYDENTFLKYGIVKRQGNIYLTVTEHIDTDEHVAFQRDITAEFTKRQEIKLCVVTEYLRREFYYHVGDAQEKLGTLDNVYYLCDEGIKKGKRFTGAMVGLYALSGSDKPFTAAFDYFEYSKEV
ncbi:MAG: family 43 glycosylhydrolase [Alistipes sp.]|nr:family 43 glycosylhydrolase [Alistipes sp.]